MRCVCVCIILLYPRAPTTSLDTLDLRLLPWTQICLTICALLTWIMTASGRGCCVPWCDKTRKDATVLHSFPNPDKDMARYNEWTRAIGTSVSSLDPQYVFRNRRVCHAHFETKYLTWSRRLSPDAVPTLFTPGAVLHAFPNPTTECGKFHTWVVNAGLVGEDYDYIYLNRRICRLHFENIYHYPKNRLSKFAIPTLHLPAWRSARHCILCALAAKRLMEYFCQ
ncbi:uncharacterized protein LOC111359841 isoform X3 [Spodoptera litura]|uniref:Uncharacterized protein LOC111359841 isoform X3 n=1 Tax=Spodoptera litura TaxID=69820 RepID=A0A9J7EHV2_SPOLT|nr:uncharacterized protein LOC111359841 isoform X3 [Spodoptera litura]